MNIYLDTNILFADPFFKSNFSELLLKSSADKSINLYIPKICLNELFFKLTAKARVLETEIKNKTSELNKWTDTKIDVINFDLTEFEKLIQKFYKEKLDDHTFIQLNHQNDYFTENLEKAIRGIAPFFTDRKEEFRDSLIWSTIREHSINDKSNKKYFLTANYADFWNFEKTDLHPNLKKESYGIIVVESVKKLFEIETSLIDFKKRQEFQIWLDKQGITINSIQESIRKYLWNHISNSIDAAIKKYSIKNLNSDFDLGYIIPDIVKENFTVAKIDNIVSVEEFATFEVSSKFTFTGKLFLPNYEKGDFSNSETKFFVANICLILSYDKDSLFKPVSTKVNKIEIE